MNTELKIIEVPEENALSLFTSDKGLDPLLDEVFKQARSFVPDLSTKKGRDAVASLAFKVSKSKTAIDSVGKDLVSKLKEQPKLVDAERKRVRDLLDGLRDEVRQPLTDWENAEKSRIESIKAMVNSLSIGDVTRFETAEQANSHIERLNSMVIDDSYDEFKSEAIIARDAALTEMKSIHESLVKREAEQRELEELRAKQLQQEQKDRDEAIAREAAEAAQRQAEKVAEDKRIAAEEEARAEREAAHKRELELKEATEKAEQEIIKAKRQAEEKAEAQRLEVERLAKADRDAAEKRELEFKLSVERAERAKLEAQRQAQQAEANAKAELEAQQEEERQAAIAREANKKYKASINNAALDALVATGVSKDCAKKAVIAIAEGKVPAVKIAY